MLIIGKLVVWKWADSTRLQCATDNKMRLTFICDKIKPKKAQLSSAGILHILSTRKIGNIIVDIIYIAPSKWVKYFSGNSASQHSHARFVEPIRAVQGSHIGNIRPTWAPYANAGRAKTVKKHSRVFAIKFFIVRVDIGNSNVWMHRVYKCAL